MISTDYLSKRIILFTALVATLATSAVSSFGQSTSFGVRITPSHVPGAMVENSSPSNIYGPQSLNVNAGIYLLKYFGTGRMGIKAGLEHGAVKYEVGVDAPRNAFGMGTGGDSQINIGFGLNSFSYNALTVSYAYKLPIKKRFLEFTIGPSLRYYGYGKDGFYEIILAFNRSTPYDENDPAAGPPDVRTRVTDLDHVYLSVPVSLDYVVRTGKRSQVKFGIMHNISSPLHGELEVQMYGKFYQGTFRPKTGFWGINVQYERLTKKSDASYKKREVGLPSSGIHRKSLFIETYIKPDFLKHDYVKPSFFSVNYDIRLKKHSNQGFGFTGGVGLGDQYLTTVQTDNKPNLRRTLTLPIGLNYIIGAQKHGGELGASIIPQIPLNKVRDGFSYRGTSYNLRLGYRFQPLREGFIARVAWLPTIAEVPLYSDRKIEFGNIGVSVGYSFK